MAKKTHVLADRKPVRKKCTKCFEYKFLVEFNKRNDAKDGRQSHCRLCRSTAGAEYRKQECVTERKRAYYQTNQKQLLESRKLRYNKTCKSERENNLDYYHANKHLILARRKQLREKTKDEDQIRSKTWRRSFDGLSYQLLYNAKKRSLNKNVECSIDRDFVRSLLEQHSECPITLAPFVIGIRRKESFSRTLDRLVPDKGYTATNTLLVSSLANTVKNNASIGELKALVGSLEIIHTFPRTLPWVKKMSVLGLAVHENDKLIQNNLFRSRSKRSAPWTLKKSDIVIPSHCPLLGVELQAASGRPSDCSPTLDRVDNGKGYTLNNIQVVSLKANRMKSNCTLVQLQTIYNGYTRYLKETNE